MRSKPESTRPAGAAFEPRAAAESTDDHRIVKIGGLGEKPSIVDALENVVPSSAPIGSVQHRAAIDMSRRVRGDPPTVRWLG